MVFYMCMRRLLDTRCLHGNATNRNNLIVVACILYAYIYITYTCRYICIMIIGYCNDISTTTYPSLHVNCTVRHTVYKCIDY